MHDLGFLFVCLLGIAVTAGLGAIALRLTRMLEDQRIQFEANARCVDAKNETDYRALEKEGREALDKEREAHNVTRDRLYASWKEGHYIPPAPESDTPPDLALPDELAPIWEDWDSALGKEKQKAVLRQAIKSGRTVSSLLVEYGIIQLKD